MTGFRRKNKAPKIIFDGEKKRSRHFSGSLLSRRGVRGAEAVILAALCPFLWHPVRRPPPGPPFPILRRSSPILKKEVPCIFWKLFPGRMSSPAQA